MKRTFLLSIPILATVVISGCKTTSNPLSSAETPSVETNSESYVFGWGSVPDEIAKPRGGTSKGAPIELSAPRELPLSSIASADSKFEKDRAAILSLAGDYKAGFHFLETLGLFPEHTMARPYHSWATEKVLVVEEQERFISLQHILVMYFVQEDGTVSEPMVMKHWRQDWTYEDTDLHTYRGDRTWSRDVRSPESVAGKWSQSVWQVDDSPRYEAIGEWTHDGNRSMWTGENTFRPLPRREHSVRDDYDVMEGFHRITITPTGWLHEQNNWKRVAGDSTSLAEYRGHEIGIDRYELIDSPSLDAADAYWERTAAYWAEVRKAWQSVYKTNNTFTLRGQVDGQSQFMRHFEYAGKLDEGEPFNQPDASGFARDIVQLYIANE